MTRDEIIKEAEEFQIKHELEMEMAAHKGIVPYIITLCQREDK